MTNEEAIKEINRWLDGCPWADTKEAFELAINALKERPKGEWKTVEGIDGDEYYECSNCGEPWVLTAGTPKDNNMNFCPNCGADMRGDAKNE